MLPAEPYATPLKEVPCRLAGMEGRPPLLPVAARAQGSVHHHGGYGIRLRLPLRNSSRHALMMTHLFFEPEVPPDRLERLRAFTSVQGLTEPVDQAPYVRARLLEPQQQVLYLLETRFAPRRAGSSLSSRSRRAARTAYACLASLERLRLNLHWQFIDRRQRRWAWAALELALEPPPHLLRRTAERVKGS